MLSYSKDTIYFQPCFTKHNKNNRMKFMLWQKIVQFICSHFCNKFVIIYIFVFQTYFVLLVIFKKSYKEIEFNVHIKLIFHHISEIVDRFLTAEGWNVALKLLSSSLLSARHKNYKHIYFWCNITVNNLFIWWRLFIFS